MQSILQRLQRIHWRLFLFYVAAGFLTGSALHVGSALLALLVSGGLSLAAVLALLKAGSGVGAITAGAVAVGLLRDVYRFPLPSQVTRWLERYPIARDIVQEGVEAFERAKQDEPQEEPSLEG